MILGSDIVLESFFDEIFAKDFYQVAHFKTVFLPGESAAQRKV
jgi:hypothetical protein